jgi:hypothetical protein
MINKYKNYVILVIDGSSSMTKHVESVKQLVNKQIELMRTRSNETDQETRLSVYVFADKTDCIVFDTDVLRPININEHYKAYGNTALIGSVLKAIEDAEKIPQIYHDCSFLIYTITDGENNVANHLAPILKQKITSLKENWTLACFVPSQTAAHYAKSYGFPANNVEVWDISSREGLESVTKTVLRSTETYFSNRTAGIRGTNNLFKLNTNIDDKTIKSNLKEIDPTNYCLLSVHSDAVIKNFVESWKITYVPGCAYYLLTKPEKIQANKQICLKNKLNGKVYAGPQAREILGLPNHEVKVEPSKIHDYDVFCQSFSTNRKLIAGTNLLVFK